MTRLIPLVVISMLVGCSAVTTIPTQVQTADTTIRTSGGSFSGAYVGTESSGFNCVVNQTFTFSGSGSASFIHNSTETGSMEWHGPGCNMVGRATITNKNHPSNSINVALTYSAPPCERFKAGPNFTIVGGTGKFKTASGDGRVKFTCHPDGTYTDQWSGTITF